MTTRRDAFFNAANGIVVRGARENNLKNIDAYFPRNQITVVTGLSGSGKSTLAFDTVYAEGQRRYIESLSAYARYFLESLKKPDVDSIDGLSPAIAIDQRLNLSSPRSTVGTVTEIYDYLRLLFAKVGTPYCPSHHLPVSRQTPEAIVDEILQLPCGSRFLVLAPIVQEKKGEFTREIESWISQGFLRAQIDGELVELTTIKKLAKNAPHNIDLVVDRLIIKQSLSDRLRESIHTALRIAKGTVVFQMPDNTRKFSSVHAACPECGFSFPELDSRSFSFNNPKGACSTCNGVGSLSHFDFDSSDDPIDDYLDGDDSIRVPTLPEMSICPDCKGSRLKAEARSVFISNLNISQLSSQSAFKLQALLSTLTFQDRHRIVASNILTQLNERLGYAIDVGVGYLEMNRPIWTLSGGEAQRIRLASQIGSPLVGVLYVLDEPSIGLHARDFDRMLGILQKIKNLGNTIVMVEHDEKSIRSADHIIDLGPRAGVLGGEVVAQGSLRLIQETASSLTGQYLSGQKQIKAPEIRRDYSQALQLSLEGACGNNLKNISVSLPLGCYIAVTGVSGSGKSSLILDTLFPALYGALNKTAVRSEKFTRLQGTSHLRRVIEVNQRPIGRTPRSNPATYTGLFDLIRKLFASHPESKMRGFTPGRFSFNVRGGRCESCQGAGLRRIEMNFLADVFVQCDVCLGRRYNLETLEIRYRNQSIADVLDMNVGEALLFFKNHQLIYSRLETLHRVGLDYITLGQSATTLSGGEAQRIKLSRELSKKNSNSVLYLLDEPTTGLHFDDVAKLIQLLHDLVQQGNTVVVIEHNLDVIKCADYIIDLGPEGGDLGGYLLASGSPEEIAQVQSSVTGQLLRGVLASRDKE